VIVFVTAPLLDHQQGMIKQEHLQFGTITTRPSPFLDCTLEEEFSLFVPQPKVLQKA
jgi:hypothetical protein